MSSLQKKIEALAASASVDKYSPEYLEIAALIGGLEKDRQELLDLELWQNNPILSSDAYKASHFEVCPDGAEFVYSYIESRGSDRKWKKHQFFGLQAFRKRYLSKPITMAHIDYAEKIITGMGLPFNRSGWEYILTVHKGYLPLRIKAVREGTVLDTRNVLVTVVNTDPKCFWLTNYIETALLRAVWYPSTVASLSFHCKLAILRAFIKSSDEDVRPLLSSLSFKLNDFGARGVSSKESAEIGGMGHLINFRGSDGIEAVAAAERYYGAVNPAGSICAAEHSTVTSWGRTNENKAYARMLERWAKPGSVLAVVSDSYDLFHAVKEIWGKELKQRVIDSGATIVIRPDSGDALTIPVGVIKAAADAYGYTTNSKGYKVLPSCIRVIQGDGITEETLPIILENLLAAGFSVDNIAFGMGGGLLQILNRDTLKFAMKCSAISIGGVWYDVFKQPKTDAGKASKKGRFALVLIEDDSETPGLENYRTVPYQNHGELNQLVLIYEDGKHYNEETWDEIVARSHNAALAIVGLL
jgi:nicotinamide phosphoribosyltransferase